MALRVLLISGTGAPPRSEFYYRPVLNVAKKHVEQVDFETIFMLGLGDMRTAAKRISNKYFTDSNDQFVLIGHSQGAILASLIAIEHQEKVVAVIALAGPFKGTTWTDPINMPVRGVIEAIKRVSGGRVHLKPTLRRFVIPILPIVKDLAAHSDINEEVLEYLEYQIAGHETHAIIGTGDMLVFPHRSANPTGPMVTNYIVADDKEFEGLQAVLPDDIKHINSRAGHISIIFNDIVLMHIGIILRNQKSLLLS